MAVLDYDTVDAAMDEYYRMHPAPAQFHRFGETTKWFRPESHKFIGNRYHFKVYTTPYTATRASDFATAATATQEFPAGGTIAYEDLSYGYTDLTIFQGTVEINELAEERTADVKHAVYHAVQRILGDAELDAGIRVNLAVHQSSSCVMGTVAAKYNEDGTTYTSGQLDAFLRITDAPIGRFVKGMLLKLDNDEEVTVNDVIYGSDGPANGGSVTGIGPGIVVTKTSTNLDGVTAADAITLSGETTSDGLQGFADWFSESTDVYKDGDGAAKNRDAKGNQWSIPHIYQVAASGAEVDFDMDTHLGTLADKIVHRIGVARIQRKRDNREKDITWPSTLTAITTPEIAASVARDGRDTVQFMRHVPGSKDEAKRDLFGAVGFDGVVWHSATLGTVAFQADPVAARFKLRIMDPQSWVMLTLGAQAFGIEWLKTGGSRFTRKAGTNGRPTFVQVAAFWSAALMFCDQPGAQTEITGVKSDLES